MPSDMRTKVAETMYHYGFNRDESDRLAGQIIRNLERYAMVQEAQFRMGLID